MPDFLTPSGIRSRASVRCPALRCQWGACLVLITINLLSAPSVAHSSSRYALAESDPPRIEFGLRAGILSTELAYADGLSEGEEARQRLSWLLGFDVRYPVNSTVTFESGFQYAQRGGKLRTQGRTYTTEWITLDLDTEVILGYMVTPFRLKFANPDEGPRPYIRCGADLGFIAHTKAETRGTITDEEGTQTPFSSEDDVDSLIGMSDVGLSLELGYEFPIGRTRGYFELCGTVGLKNINQLEDEGAIRNRSFGLAVGTRF